MLRILGSRKTLCDGLTRRDLLQIGGTGMLGLGLADALRLEAAADTAAKPASFGKSGHKAISRGAKPANQAVDGTSQISDR